MRRNQQSEPPLPEGWELLAVAYGTSPDDYLGLVLAYSYRPGEYIEDKWVTWIWNSDRGCEGVGEGRYFDAHHFENGDSNAEDMARLAWKNFQWRAERFITPAHRWARLPKHPAIHHIDGDVRNNQPDNLRIVPAGADQ